jgi:peptidoglycan/LPS O-acetylase OafA/YrhL
MLYKVLLIKKIETVFFEKKRIYGLDILRAIAILMVLYEHSGRFIMKWGFAKHYSALHVDGVSIFFVLSGFLIGGILIKSFKKKELLMNDIKIFWLNRWFRTLPNYFSIIFIVLILSFLTNRAIPVQLNQYFFFTQNFATIHPAFFPEAWSLAVEEWFYLLVPLILFVLVRTSLLSLKRAVLVLVFVVITLSFFIRLYKTGQVINDWDLDIRKQVITRMDSIMFGVFGAWLLAFKENWWGLMRKPGIVLSISFLLALKMMPSGVGWKTMVQLPIESLMVFFAMPFFYSIKSGKGFFYRSITIISILSYSMYLLNFTIIFDFILNGFGKEYWEFSMQESILKFCLFWVLSIGIALFPYLLVELPFMKLRSKLVKQHD